MWWIIYLPFGLYFIEATLIHWPLLWFWETNQGIFSRCSVSALPFHQGKVLHQRKALHKLSASAGHLHRKSCCSCPRWSKNASVHQLQSKNISHHELWAAIYLMHLLFGYWTLKLRIKILVYQDILSGSSWLSLSSCHGTQSRRRMVHCTPVFSAWCRWSRKQSMCSRQTTRSRIHPLEGSRGTYMRVLVSTRTRQTMGITATRWCLLPSHTAYFSLVEVKELWPGCRFLWLYAWNLYCLSNQAKMISLWTFWQLC